jgi:twitching motility two-component system response regulator PilH
MARILIVDDSPTDRHVHKKALEEAGHDIDEASSVDEGLQMLQTLQPDLILMDVVMEGTSGFQATRKIAKNPKTAGIPVIIISSKNQETDRIWGLRQGASEYLVKPVKAKQLVDTVETLLKIKPATPRA